MFLIRKGISIYKIPFHTFFVHIKSIESSEKKNNIRNWLTTGYKIWNRDPPFISKTGFEIIIFVSQLQNNHHYSRPIELKFSSS